VNKNVQAPFAPAAFSEGSADRCARDCERQEADGQPGGCAITRTGNCALAATSTGTAGALGIRHTQMGTCVE